MSPNSDKSLLLIGGPTASGKSALALDLAVAFGGVVINADSMQVYRDLRILTARPDADAESRAPHALYGVMDGAERCSVAHWRSLALKEIARATDQGLLPILVGGSGLYFRGLAKGLAPVPSIPTDIRVSAKNLMAELGNEQFHARLAERDPEMAARLGPGNTQRLIRAYEVLDATGRSLADWQAQAGQGYAGPIVTLIVDPPREALYAACDTRVPAMIEAGAEREVASLLARNLDASLPIMKALGVREISDFLSGKVTIEQTIGAIAQATRRYAKRQVTWFRNQMVADWRIDDRYSPEMRDQAVHHVRRLLLTTE
jgi:tRNA dimethylallyltransferase